MKVYLVKSNDIANLHAAYAAKTWAFKPRAKGAADRGLYSFLRKNVTAGTMLVGINTDADNYGALMYGFVRIDGSSGAVVPDIEVRGKTWQGTYAFPLKVDWNYITPNGEVAVSKDVLRDIIGDLRSGHMLKQITADQFRQILAHRSV